MENPLKAMISYIPKLDKKIGQRIIDGAYYGITELGSENVSLASLPLYNLTRNY